MRLSHVIVAGFLIIGILGMPAIANAKPTEEAVLTCGDQEFLVSGFGRGNVLHVSGSTTNYVVTFAQVESEPDGPIIIDIKGQRDKEDIITCSATSPITSRTFIFQGFFTPRSEPHKPEL